MVSGNGDGAGPSSGLQTVDPKVIQVLLLDEIAVGIRELSDLVKLQLPLGLTPYIPITVTSELLELPIKPPWFSVHVLNDGPGVLLFNINTGAQEAIEIRNGEDQRFDFQKPVIHALFLQAVTGSAALRLVGTR